MSFLTSAHRSPFLDLKKIGGRKDEKREKGKWQKNPKLNETKKKNPKGGAEAKSKKTEIKKDEKEERLTK